MLWPSILLQLEAMCLATEEHSNMLSNAVPGRADKQAATSCSPDAELLMGSMHHLTGCIALLRAQAGSHLGMEGALALLALGSRDGLEGVHCLQLRGLGRAPSQVKRAGEASSRLLGSLSTLQRPKITQTARIGVVQRWGHLAAALQIPAQAFCSECSKH